MNLNTFVVSKLIGELFYMAIGKEYGSLLGSYATLNVFWNLNTYSPYSTHMLVAIFVYMVGKVHGLTYF